MLVLSRKKNESIIIADNLSVTLIAANYKTEMAAFLIKNSSTSREVYKKADESFLVCDKVKIKIIEVCANRVKIGIEAPRDILIYREEIQRKRLINI